MKKALLIIDVQKSSVTNQEIISKIEALQSKYDNVFISKFINKYSPLLNILNWNGYENEELAFKPAAHAKVFEKNIYTSFIDDLREFEEVHLCGFDTDACVYKTALDLIEQNIRPIILSEYCGSENEEFHKIGLKLLKRNIGSHNVV